MTILTQKIKSDEIISDLIMSASHFVLFFATSFSSPCWPNKYSNCKILSLIGWLIFLFVRTAMWVVLLETLFTKPGNIMACVDLEENNLPAVLFLHPAALNKCSNSCWIVEYAPPCTDSHSPVTFCGASAVPCDSSESSMFHLTALLLWAWWW